MLLSDKIDFKAENIIKDKERYLSMIKESIYQEDTIIINISTPKRGAPKYMKRKLT